LSDRRAIIVGSRGQDGQLLTRLLRNRGDAVLGIGRNSVDIWGQLPRPAACRVDDLRTVCDTVRAVQPDEVYYLAAHHGSSETRALGDSHRNFIDGMAVNVAGVVNFLEALRQHAPRGRLFYASSSLVFGNQPQRTPQDETTPLTPDEPYGLCKALGSQACQEYRQRHGVFACVGILFNHESELRPPSFLSMKIAQAAVAASRGKSAPLVLGSLDAVVDWGFAPDFVEAFRRILALDDPDDFVIATGVVHTVRDFVAAAFRHVGLDWQAHVVEDRSVLARARSGRVGNPARLRRRTGWHTSVSFEEMVHKLVDGVAMGTTRRTWAQRAEDACAPMTRTA
jgi:GDPmannose 4,6-dehydratase